MEWLSDPTVWVGLAALVAMEIVLGIDNLIFIAILSDKLPPEQRQTARITGLSLALLMRLVLLASISWVVTLTEPLFHVLEHGVSGRDLIMFIGGGFLIFKATMELHEKLEGAHHKKTGPIMYANFAQVIVQIVVLDAVFSLDSVITAIGMADHLSVMMLAVLIAMGVMIWASKSLMDFVSAHPTVVILCLGFLLMIGFSLVVEGMGYHIPKGYLYAAIGFSVLIEGLNQFAQRNRRKAYAKVDLRTRTSMAIINLLGGGKGPVAGPDDAGALVSSVDVQTAETIFGPQERLMIQRVMNLAEQSIQSIMTPRHDLYWIDLNDDPEVILKEIRECPYSCLVVVQNGEVEAPLGIILQKELALMDASVIARLKDYIHQPLMLPENMTVLQALDSFRQSRIHVAFIIDEYGTLDGLATLTDVVEAIAGDLPEDHDSDDFSYMVEDDGVYTFNGNFPVQQLPDVLGEAVPMPDGDFHTVAGIALTVLKRIPDVGDSFALAEWQVTVEAMDKRRIKRLRFAKAVPEAAS